MAKICCGGFNIGDGLELDGKTLKATGGGAGGMVVNVTATYDEETEESSATADKTVAEIIEAAKLGIVTANILFEGSVIASVPLVFAGSDGVEFGIAKYDPDEERLVAMASGYNEDNIDIWEVNV